MATIEERIVNMRFNNAGFESGVRNTMGLLDRLKSALSFRGGANGIEEVNASMGRFNINPITSGLQMAGNQFSMLQTVATGALLTIGNKVVDLAGQLAGGLSMKPIMEGFQEYETKIGSIQTIYANTHEKYGTSYGDITASLDELNTYADKTIYNFGDMTRNIGLFTNAGLELGPSVSMIKGFSNAAAASGTDAQRAAGAAYQLSQGLSQGKITLMDWNSLVNAGMGNAVMKEGLVDIAHAMGTLDKSVMTTSEDIEKNFRDSLQQGWITSDVMSTYLQIMSGDMDDAAMAAKGLSQEQIEAFRRQQIIGEEAATKVRTFTQLTETLGEAVGSGWGQAIEIIFGEFEQATELWTGISDTLGGIIEKSTNARNALLQGWSDMGGRAAVLEGLKNAFNGLFEVASVVGESFRKVFPAITAERLVDLSNKFRDFTKLLIPSESTLVDLGIILEKVFRIPWAIGMSLRKIFYALDAAFKSVFKTVEGGASIFGILFEYVVPLLDKLPAALAMGRHTATQVYAIFRAIFQVVDIVIYTVGSIIGAILKLIPTTGSLNLSFLDIFFTINENLNAFRKWYKSADGLSKIFDNIIPIIKNVVAGFGDFISKLLNVSPFNAIGERIGHLGNGFQFFGDILSKVFGGIGKAFQLFFGSFDSFGDIIETIFSGLGKAIEATLGYVDTFIDNLADSLDGKDFSGLFDGINTAIFAGMALLLKNLLGEGTFIEQIKKAIFGDDDDDGDDDDKGSLLGRIKKFLVGDGDEDDLSILGKTKEAISGAFEPLTDTLETMQTTLKAATLMQIAFAVAALSASIILISTVDSAKLTKALTAITVMFAQLAGMLYVLQAMNIGKMGMTLPLIGAGLMLIAGAVGMLVIPVMALAQLDWDQLVRGLTGIGVLLLELSVAVKLMSGNAAGMISAGIGITGIAIGLNILVLAVKQLAGMELSQMGQGLIGIAGALMIIAAGANMLPKNLPITAAGVVILAGGMVILAGAIKILGSMDLAQMGQGLIGMAGALMIIATAMNLMPANLILTASGMVILGQALVIIGGALVIISSMGAGDSFQSLIVLAGALTILAVGVNAMNGALVGAAALVIVTAALAGFVPILLTLGTLPWSVILTGIAALAISFGVLAAAGYLLTPVIPTLVGLAAAIGLLGASVLLILGGLALFIASIGLLVAAIAQLGLVGVDTINGLLSLLPAFFAALGAAIVELLKQLAGAGTEIVNFVVTVIGSVLEAVKTLVPQIVETVRTILTSLLNLIIEMTPTIMEAFRVIVTNILDTVIQMTPQIVDAVITLCTGILNAISTLTPQVVQTGVDMVMALVNGIVALIPQLVDAGMRLIIGILDGIARNIGQVIDKGSDVIVNFLEGIQRNIPRVAQEGADTIIAFIDGLAGAIRNNAQRLRDSAKNLGWEIINGLTGGLAEKAGNALQQAANVGSSILNKMKEKLGINSPSRYTKEYGMWLMEGLAIGQDKHMSKAVDSAETAGDKTLKALNKSLANGINDISLQPKITPILDLSEAKKAAGSMTFKSGLGLFSSNRAQSIATDMQPGDVSGAANVSNVTNVNFTQNNTSPKALDSIEIYRQSKNTLSQLKREVFA